MPIIHDYSRARFRNSLLKVGLLILGKASSKSPWTALLGVYAAFSGKGCAEVALKNEGLRDITLPTSSVRYRRGRFSFRFRLLFLTLCPFLT